MPTLYFKNAPSVSVDTSRFVASGGQADIYAVGDTAYKIYHNPSAMMPIEKMEELKPLPLEVFSRPISAAYKDKACSSPIGYTLKFHRDTYLLGQMFPLAFRKRHNLTVETIAKIALQIKRAFDLAHKADILLIDPNESNFLVAKDFSKIICIDTDSYQTKSFPATAIMDSIRDRHMASPTAFTKESDWFSFAVIIFQLFFGIHPYKGTHPEIKTLDERMKANVSIFHTAVSKPKAIASSETIPIEWRQWFHEVFDLGERKPPPDVDIVQAAPTPSTLSASTKNLVSTLDFLAEGGRKGTIFLPPFDNTPKSSNPLHEMVSHRDLKLKEVLFFLHDSISQIFFATINRQKLFGVIFDDCVRFYTMYSECYNLYGSNNTASSNIPFLLDKGTTARDSIFPIEGFLGANSLGKDYFLSDDRSLVFGVEFHDNYTRSVYSQKVNSNLTTSELLNKGHIYDFCYEEDGGWGDDGHFHFFDQNGVKVAIVNRPFCISEEIAHAKYRDGVLVVTSTSFDGYRKIYYIKYDKSFKKYKYRVIEDVDRVSSVEFLPKGLCILSYSMTPPGKMLPVAKIMILSTDFDKDSTKTINDPWLAFPTHERDLHEPVWIKALEDSVFAVGPSRRKVYKLSLN